jgi:hypothetical protein
VLVIDLDGERMVRLRIYLPVVNSAPLLEEPCQEVHRKDEPQQLTRNLHPGFDPHVCGGVKCFVVRVDTRVLFVAAMQRRSKHSAGMSSSSDAKTA